MALPAVHLRFWFCYFTAAALVPSAWTANAPSRLTTFRHIVATTSTRIASPWIIQNAEEWNSFLSIANQLLPLYTNTTAARWMPPNHDILKSQDFDPVGHTAIVVQGNYSLNGVYSAVDKEGRSSIVLRCEEANHIGDALSLHGFIITKVPSSRVKLHYVSTAPPPPPAVPPCAKTLIGAISVVVVVVVVCVRNLSG